MDERPVVFLVSDKSKCRRLMAKRLKQLGYDWQAFNDIEDFQQRPFPTEAGCIMFGVADADGDLAWLREAGLADAYWPVIGVAAEADVESAVVAMKSGCCDFVLDSCSDRRLTAAIDEAFHREAAQRRRIATVQSILRRMQQLTPPLNEVLALLLKGRSNREMADELERSERTIEDRRAQVMKTMKARSLADLVRKVMTAGGATAALPPRDQGRIRPAEPFSAKELSGQDRRRDHKPYRAR